MKKIVKYLDKPLLITTVILFAIGLIMVFSSSNVTAYMSKAVSPYYYFLRQGIFLIIGVILFIIIIRIPSKTYGPISWFLLVAVTISLGLLLIVGHAKNRALSWYDFGFFSFQPSEFVKIIMIVWMGAYYEKKVNKLDSYLAALFPLAIAAVIAFLIFFQPDLGTTILFCGIVGLLFVSMPIKRKIKWQTVLAILGILFLAFVAVKSTGKDLIASRQSSRFDFFRPCDKLLTTGNQVCNSYIAINNGGLLGVGLGKSTQKYLYLPESYTDFIFSIILEELGSLSGIAIILMFMFVLYRILSIGSTSPTIRGKTICYGVAIYIFFHIAVNLMGIFGLIPMTGVPLPFMSYGGSFTICLMVALTLVQRVSVENGIFKEHALKSKKSV